MVLEDEKEPMGLSIQNSFHRFDDRINAFLQYVKHSEAARYNNKDLFLLWFVNVNKIINEK